MYDFLFDIFFFKQKTAYEMRISDWSSDVCSSDLAKVAAPNDWICPALLALNARIFMVPARIPPPLTWKTELLPLAVPARLNREQIGRASCRERVCQYV